MFFITPFLFSLCLSHLKLLDNFRSQPKPITNETCTEFVYQDTTILDLYSIIRLSIPDDIYIY